ncbi:MAG: putative transport system permease protein [Chloroflexota bacterium]|nr:putative transport system permease protein [Chloroflexota bacterium]
MSSILIALRRLRGERVPAIGLALLIFITATLFGVAPRLIDAVANGALRGVIAETTAFRRNIALIEEGYVEAGSVGPLDAVNESGDRLTARIPAPIRNLVSTRRLVVDSVRFRVRAPTNDPTFIRFRIQPGAAERLDLVAGRMPTAGLTRAELPKELLDQLPIQGQHPDPVTVPELETAVAGDGLRQTGLELGDRVFMSVDGSDPLAARRRGVIAVRIVGVIAARDRSDPFWYDDQSLAQVTIRSIGGDTRFLDLGGFLPEAAYGALIQADTEFSLPSRYTWRHFIDPGLLAADRLDSTIVDLRRLETAFPTSQLVNNEGAAMQSGLLPELIAHAGRWASASALLSVVAIGPAAVALAALGLVATMAARRRRTAIALVRGRGGTLGQIVRAVFLEGFVIAVPGLGLAVALAIVLVPVGSNRSTILAATVVALTAIALLIVTALRSVTAARAAVRDDDPPPRAVNARRIVLDVVVIGAAVVGAVLLRERGVRGASSAGSLAEADPLIAAVPVLAGIAAGLTLTRLVAVPLRVLGRIAGRGRGLVALLAVRRAIHGGTTGAILVVLLVTASVGAFSGAALSHLGRAGVAESWQEVGAPFRVVTSGTLPSTFAPTKLPGVRGVADMFKVTIPVGPRSIRITLAAIDLAAYQGIVGGSPADLLTPPEMLAPEPADGVIPLLVSPDLAARAGGMPVGQTTDIQIAGISYHVRPIGLRARIPTVPPETAFAVVSRQQLRAVRPSASLTPTTVFIDAPETSETAIRDAVAPLGGGTTFESRAVVARAFDESPVTAAIAAGIALAALVTAIYAALAVTAALALAGAARATEVAHLRMIGLSRGDALRLAIVEHGPTVLLAFVAGVALGLGLFIVLQPGLGLDALVGSRLDVPVVAEPRDLAVIGGGLLAIATVGIGLAAWTQRSGIGVAALRRELET